MHKIRPVIGWPGGKRLLAKHILPMIPRHTCYVEVFGGSLAILCAKEKSHVEVVNDIDGELISFYRTVRFHLDELLRELLWFANSRQEFLDFLQQPGLTEIQRAARWFYRNKMSFGAMGRHFGTSKVGGGASLSSRRSIWDALEAFNRRMDSVCIENLSFEKILQTYDGPKTFFYMDPPYVTGDQDCYSTRWKKEDHVRLREAVRGIKGRWLLSYCDSSLVRKLYAGCRLRSIERVAGIDRTNKRKPKIFRELLITK